MTENTSASWSDISKKAMLPYPIIQKGSFNMWYSFLGNLSPSSSNSDCLRACLKLGFCLIPQHLIHNQSKQGSMCLMLVLCLRGWISSRSCWHLQICLRVSTLFLTFLCYSGLWHSLPFYAPLLRSSAFSWISSNLIPWSAVIDILLCNIIIKWNSLHKL